MTLGIPFSLLEETFASFRRCGAGRRECQALWTGPRAEPGVVSHLIHPRHTASPIGFQLEDAWLNWFWWDLADRQMSVRAQVHTHPGPAYHSATDDAYPIVHTAGFLSLVIPHFAQGPVGFQDAFLAQIDSAGRWSEVPIHEHLKVV